eukprot:Nk52_evm30s1485 gene=Nk52_evmTU30s1485
MVKKKQFIDKKKSVRFNLVHRSQRDPLINDEDASKLVLHPVNGVTEADLSFITSQSSTPNENPTESDLINSFDQVKLADDRQRQQEKASEAEDQHQLELLSHGITFEDGYDYMKHLKQTGDGIFYDAKTKSQKNNNGFQLKSDQQEEEEEDNQKTKQISELNLPSGVISSGVEEEIGMLHLAAPQSGPLLDWDPEIVAALDDGVDFDDEEWQLEDDFMTQAQEEEESEGDYESGEGDYDDCMSTDGRFYDYEDDYDGFEEEEEEETGTRFTNYSMTSSVMRRSEGLSLLDDRFEQLMMAEYADEQIGGYASDDSDIRGHITDVEQMKELLDDVLEFQEEMQHGRYKPTSGGGGEKMKKIVMRRREVMNEESGEMEEVEEEEIIDIEPLKRSTRDAMIMRDVEKLKERIKEQVVRNEMMMEKEKERRGKEKGMEEQNVLGDDVDVVEIIKSGRKGDDDDVMGKGNGLEDDWDCETILTTYSNIYNHPRQISERDERYKLRMRQREKEREMKMKKKESGEGEQDEQEEEEKGGEQMYDNNTGLRTSSSVIGSGGKQTSWIKISRKTGIPLGVLGTKARKMEQEKEEQRQKSMQRKTKKSNNMIAKEEEEKEEEVIEEPSEGETDNEEDEEGEEETVVVNSGAARQRGETREEKRLRKAQVKADRRARRETKKAMKVAFKEEEMRQETMEKVHVLTGNRIH